MGSDRRCELMSVEEALREANRCLMCDDAPCTKGCPAGVDVSAFIRKIRFEDFRGAAACIRASNVLASVCALVCPTGCLCEERCNHTSLNYPIEIGRLQRFAASWSAADDVVRLKRESSEFSGRRAAVVGGGPAGLSAAVELALNGVQVVVHDSKSSPGGLLRYGLPRRRLPLEDLDRELELISPLFEWKGGAALGGELTLERLRSSYDAVVVAVGLGCGRRLGIPGEDAEGVLDALSFLEEKAQGKDFGLRGRRVVVVGGGNTAMDAAAAAVEEGASDVFLLYRRSFNELPAWSEEVEHVLRAGVHILILTQPVEFVERDGRLEAVRAVRCDLGERGPDGRRKPLVLEDQVFDLECDAAIVAAGQEPVASLLESEGLEIGPRGTVKVDENFMTSIPGVFAAGDVVNGGATVVQAVAEGKAAARGVLRYLSGSAGRRQ